MSEALQDVLQIATPKEPAGAAGYFY